MDITEEILRQHDEQRHLFAILDNIAPDDTGKLAAVWKRLAILLEVHAEGEEKLFYPKLVKVGQGPDGDEGPDDEVEDAIKDHNKIRDAVEKADGLEVGSEPWWDAVRQARKENSEHMAEEEREDLPDFRRSADPATRHAIAVEFAVYCAAHAGGIAARDKDPGEYVAEHR